MQTDTIYRLSEDPLLSCLVLFTKLYNIPYSAEALVAGLPIEKGVGSVELFSLKGGSKSLFSRAAKRAGFITKLSHKSLSELSPLVLPCIIILKDRSACILESFVDDRRKEVKIIHPDIPDGEHIITLEELEKEYIGYCFLLKKEFIADTNRNQILENSGSSWFWGTVKRSKQIYIDVILASLVVNLFVLASPLFTMNVYDRVIPNNAVETLWVLALGLFVVYVLDIVLKFLRSYFLEIAGKKSDVIMSSIIFEKVMDLKMAVRPKSVGSFASNLRDFDSIRNFLTSSTLATLIDLPFAFIFLITIHFIASYMVLVPFVLMLAILAYTLSIKKSLQESIESTYQASAIKNGILIESLNAMETIKTLSAGGHAQWKWEEASGEIAQRSLKSKILSNSITTITSFFVQLNTIVVVVLGVYMIKEMELTMGGLIAAVILSSRAIAPMGQVAALIASFEQTRTAYKAIDDIMKLPSERPSGKKFVRREHFLGKIEFKNVTFSYPESNKKALDNVSFVIKAGERVGVLGRNGSGKTTIEKLILGLYAPDDGSVLIDGIDINQIDPVDLRKNIGYVPQDVVLFQGSVRDNIVYKAPYVDDETILKAAKMGGVDEFVDSHPLGYDMPVLERGDGVSGGQRQSIAISRAFLVDAPIMLLDEPTNSLDNTSENHIKKLLEASIEGRTTLLVTHKMSLLDMVERLLVIDNGRVILDGKKEDVLATLQGVRPQ
ncbi:type I secretion system permease/ATPase [Sulfurospirillum halorespirans]|uniref:Type I secretion system ATPase n=1 Tax=Sulfurospirillum halorespirans DSM 13726 TaxID=1193502 RepID=A0A1D7TIP5_9BACT|nr:type I secretion system permease/ATPase [Sulfurospirillum halorespirans]AOO64820.1 type I secretion system ATPase [Sulfurospirillum halorespirans DSM 13726]